MERPEHQQMLSLAAAIGSPAGRERLRDVTDIMLGHVGGTPGSPDDLQDAADSALLTAAPGVPSQASGAVALRFLNQ